MTRPPAAPKSLPWQRKGLLALLALALAVPPHPAPAQELAENRPARLSRAGLDDPAGFPLGVWMQLPRLVEDYAALGINLYVGLWEGPTEAQLEPLLGSGIGVIAAQTPIALAPRYNGLVTGWLLPDEPDNAQPLPFGLGHGWPTPPRKTAAQARRMVRQDPEGRPVLLNLGQGVANDRWHGRGAQSGKLGDYPAYAEAADILSFDIYPLGRPNPDTAGRIDLIGKGMTRLSHWSQAGQRLWAMIGTTQIEAGAPPPTPAQLRASVWMAVIHGARGIIYFVHQFTPEFDSSALLRDPAQMAALAEINADLTRLAPVLNAPDLPGLVAVTAPETPPALTLRALGETHYLFAIAMTAAPVTARFQLTAALGSMVTDIDSGQKIPLQARGFEASFPAGYGLRRFRIDR